MASWTQLIEDENLAAYDEFDLSILESLSDNLCSCDSYDVPSSSKPGTDSESLKTLSVDYTKRSDFSDDITTTSNFNDQVEHILKKKRRLSTEKSKNQVANLVDDPGIKKLSIEIEGNWIEYNAFKSPPCTKNVENKIRFLMEYIDLVNAGDQVGMKALSSVHLHKDCTYVLPTIQGAIPANPAFFQIFEKAAQLCPDIFFVPTCATIISNNSFLFKARGVGTLVHRKHSSALLDIGRSFADDFDMTAPTAKNINHYRKVELKAKDEDLSLQSFFHFSVLVKFDAVDSSDTIVSDIEGPPEPFEPHCSLKITAIKSWWKIVHLKIVNI